MENIISYSVLIFLAFSSLFLYERSRFIFSIVPAAVAIGATFLVLGNNFQKLDDQVISMWQTLPGLLINVVFGALLLGKQIISPKKIWRFAGPQVVFGQTLAWGQYVFGALLTLFVLIPFFNMSPFAGALIEISFEGGHGTAAGLQGLFNEVGYPEGTDLALGLATVGLIVGIASGLIMNLIYGKRRSTKSLYKNHKRLDKEIKTFVKDTKGRYFSRHVILRTIVQVMLIGLAISIGVVIKELLIYLENIVFGVNSSNFFSHMPVFPLAMIGGVIVQLALKTLKAQQIVHIRTVRYISNFALEVLIIAAIATMSLTTVGSNIEPFILLAVTGILWNITAFLLIAPKLMGKTWYRRGIGDYGQSMGMTATGLLLMHSADPHNKSQAVERFGYKQLLFEPIVGGGLFTASSLIIISEFGLNSLLGIASIVLLFWLLLGYIAFMKKR